MNLITGVTLGIALVGVVLGIINTIHSLNRDRIILRVIPVRVLTPGLSLREDLGVQIINLSYIPVVVSVVGFSLSKRSFFPSKGKKDKRIPFINPVVLEGGAFPRVLNPGFLMTILVPEQILKSEKFKSVKFAYARTSCGLIFKGNNRVLMQAIYNAKIKDSSNNV